MSIKDPFDLTSRTDPDSPDAAPIPSPPEGPPLPPTPPADTLPVADMTEDELWGALVEGEPPGPGHIPGPRTPLDVITDVQGVRLPAGKHRGQELTVLAQTDPNYLTWMYKATKDNTPYAWISAFVCANMEFFQLLIKFPDIVRQALVLDETYALIDNADYSASQAAARKKVVEFIVRRIRSKETSLIRIQGGAGKGKTFLTRAILADLIRESVYISAVMAPSYVAVEALDLALDGIGPKPKTIAREMGFRKVTRGAVEEYIITTKTHQALHDLIQNDRVVVVDECSMVGLEIAEMMYRRAVDAGGTLILIGDRHQLPPPKAQEMNWFCRLDHLAEGERENTLLVELTEPQRFAAGSPLHCVEQGVVDVMQAQQYTFASLVNTLQRNAGAEVVAHKDMTELVDVHVDTTQQRPEHDCVGIFWNNRTVARYNKAVRTELLGPTSLESPVVDGERLRIYTTMDVTSPVGEARRTTIWLIDEDGTEVQVGPGHRYYSGFQFLAAIATEEVYIGELRLTDQWKDDLVVQFRQPYFNVLWRRPDAASEHKYCANVIFGVGDYAADPDERGGLEYNSKLQEIAQLAEQDRRYWKLFHAYKDMFVKVQHAYAMTTHRAQGSSRDNVFTSVRDIFSPDPFEGPRLGYVATTRARKSLHVVI